MRDSLPQRTAIVLADKMVASSRDPSGVTIEDLDDLRSEI